MIIYPFLFQKPRSLITYIWETTVNHHFSHFLISLPPQSLLTASKLGYPSQYFQWTQTSKSGSQIPAHVQVLQICANKVCQSLPSLFTFTLAAYPPYHILQCKLYSKSNSCWAHLIARIMWWLCNHVELWTDIYFVNKSIDNKRILKQSSFHPMPSTQSWNVFVGHVPAKISLP